MFTHELLPQAALEEKYLASGRIDKHTLKSRLTIVGQLLNLTPNFSYIPCKVTAEKIKHEILFDDSSTG